MPCIGIVIPVSAIFVAMTIFRTPGGGTSKAALWFCDDKTEWRAMILYLRKPNKLKVNA